MFIIGYGSTNAIYGKKKNAIITAYIRLFRKTYNQSFNGISTGNYEFDTSNTVIETNL